MCAVLKSRALWICGSACVCACKCGRLFKSEEINNTVAKQQCQWWICKLERSYGSDVNNTPPTRTLTHTHTPHTDTPHTGQATCLFACHAPEWIPAAESFRFPRRNWTAVYKTINNVIHLFISYYVTSRHVMSCHVMLSMVPVVCHFIARSRDVFACADTSLLTHSSALTLANVVKFARISVIPSITIVPEDSLNSPRLCKIETENEWESEGRRVSEWKRESEERREANDRERER